MSDLDWNLIRSFVAVAESGSLSAAARQLSASQPTLGRHIAELERRLGVTLFQRGRAGYRLSTHGEALLGRAMAMREQAQAFSRLALGATETIAGTVRIAASEVISAFVLPDILARLALEEPAVTVEVVASNRVENLLRRDADIALRMVEPAQIDLVAVKVADIALVACAARSYVARRGRPERPEDLLDHDLVGFDREMSLIEGFRGMGVEVEREAFRFRTDNQIVYWLAVRAGNGIGFAQRPLVARDDAVEALLPELNLPRLPMWIAMHRDVRQSPRIRRVADFLAGALRAYCAG